MGGGNQMKKSWLLRRIITILLIVQIVQNTTVFSYAGEQTISNITEDDIEDNIGKTEEDTIIIDDAGADSEKKDIEEDNNLEDNINQNNTSDESLQEESASNEEDLSKNNGVNEVAEINQNMISVSYKAHVQNSGWQQSVSDGATAGTVGKGLAMEALQIELQNTGELQGDIEYCAHVQDIGWQSKVSNGSMAGTVGRAKSIEAVKINITGKLAETYDIYYRVHSATYGWFDWAKNGELAGSIGFAYAAQAIEIKLFDKSSEEKPIVTGKTYLSEDNRGDVIYQAHVQDKGWLPKKVDGQEAGLPDLGKQMEAIKIKISESTREFGGLTGSVIYQAHVQDIGWQDEVADGATAGTIGRGKQLEAIKIKLSGQLEEKYDIYYRVYIEKKGWFDWAKNGELAGSMGYGLALYAIEIKLYDKNSTEKPVTTGRTYLSEENYGKVIYQAHIQNIGWQAKATDGEKAGTTGKALGIEAIKVQIPEYGRPEGISGAIVYQAHVGGIGWQDEVQDNMLAGTVGQNRRIEAVKLHLTEQLEQYYDIYYRVHSANFGWLSWTRNGETAGTTGYGSSAEAIEIKLLVKGDPEAPEMTGRPELSRSNISTISGQAHVSSIGWMTEVMSGGIVGTTGQNKSIEALKFSVRPNGNSYSGGIKYKLHVQDIGWQDWANNGTIAGTVGKGKAAEAIQIQLTGEMQKYTDIYYRAHVSNFGWLGWAKNGQSAGTSGYAYKLEAVQIQVVPKGTSAPGDTNGAFKQAPPREIYLMQLRANMYSSPTGYLLLVNRSTHKVGIFRGWMGNWNCIQYWDCSDGKASTPTVMGVFKVGSRGLYFDSGSARCHWWTQFYGDYLFHSVLYNRDGTLQDGRLGMALSHGCVRLQIENAKWIYDNIPSSSTVVVYM